MEQRQELRTIPAPFDYHNGTKTNFSSGSKAHKKKFYYEFEETEQSTVTFFKELRSYLEQAKGMEFFYEDRIFKTKIFSMRVTYNTN